MDAARARGAPDQRRGAKTAPRAGHAPHHAPGSTSGPLRVLGPTTSAIDLASAAGNRAFRQLLADQVDHVVQRVPVSYDDTGETLYEDPAAGQTQFQPTSYSSGTVAGGGGIQYEMTRSDTEVTVTVDILFVSQARDTRETLPDGRPNPNYQFYVGAETAIAADDPRRQFAVDRCATIGGTWNRYALVGRPLPPPAPSGGTGPTDAGTPLPGGTASPEPEEIRLPLNFVANPVFDPAASSHSKVRVFGPATAADRSGAHPIDSGNWYMNTTNYGDADVDAIYAHEYGHLVGLQDEYFRSNDQVHQTLHRMGGGAATSDAAVDRETLRRMVMAALGRALQSRLRSVIGEVSAAFMAQHELLRTQLKQAIRTTWQDPGLRAAIADTIRDEVPARYRSQVERVVEFQTARNLSNVLVANEAMTAMTAASVERSALSFFRRQFDAFVGSSFGVTGADGTRTTMSLELSGNVTGAASSGSGAAAGSALADRVVGAASVPIPAVRPSSTLVGQLNALPETWRTPGSGIDAAYSPAAVIPLVREAAAAAVATGAIGRIGSTNDLYRRVLGIVNGTVRASSRDAVTSFVDSAIHPAITSQVTALRGQIDTEVDAVMGLTAGAAAARSPRDPDITSIATQLHTLLQSQQNSGSWDQTADINPGASGSGVDVRYSMDTMMGTNVTGPEGFRADMIQPIVDQFNGNAALRDPRREEAFRPVRR